MTKSLLACCVGLCLMPLLAPAQPAYVNIEQRLTPEQLHATGIDTLSAAQLELLNRLLREPAPASSSVAAASTPPADPAPAPAAVATPNPQMLIGLDDGPIKSRLVGTVTAWEPGTEFELVNGQRWKVLKGSVTLRKALQNPEVIVVPGIAGRWFIQIDESMPKARVYRIK